MRSAPHLTLNHVAQALGIAYDWRTLTDVLARALATNYPAARRLAENAASSRGIPTDGTGSGNEVSIGSLPTFDGERESAGTLKKSEKKRPRNPFTPDMCNHSIPVPTVPGEQVFSGKGGGAFRFKDGKLLVVHPVNLSREWTLEDAAHCLKEIGRMGLPIPKEGSNREDVDFLANGLIKAIHEGDYPILNRIADVMREPGKYLPAPGSRWSMIVDAVSEAAKKKHGVPTREEVGEVLASVKDPNKGGYLFTTVRESDKLQAMLESVGFGWLPHKKRGEHLRKK